jgi:hypothetical protein
MENVWPSSPAPGMQMAGPEEESMESSDPEFVTNL